MLRRRPQDNPLQRNVRMLLGAAPRSSTDSLELPQMAFHRRPWARIRSLVRRGSRRLKQIGAKGWEKLDALVQDKPPIPGGRRLHPRQTLGGRPLTPVEGVPCRARRWDLDRWSNARAVQGKRAAVTTMRREGEKLRRQWTCDQSQSALFARLPTEIRLKIFKHVLAGRFLQLTPTPSGQPLSLNCSHNIYDHGHVSRESSPCILHLFHRFKPCGSTIDTDIPGSFFRSAADREHKMLPLLQTCRRM
jgi:hypothetical protein